MSWGIRVGAVRSPNDNSAKVHPAKLARSLLDVSPVASTSSASAKRAVTSPQSESARYKHRGFEDEREGKIMLS